MEKYSILNVFKEFCEKEGLDFNVKNKELRGVLHYNTPSEGNGRLEEVTYTKYLNSATPASKRDYIVFARLLHLSYGIPYENFGFSPQKILELPKYFPSSKMKEVINLLDLKANKIGSLYSNYKKALAPFEKIKNNLTCYNYLDFQKYYGGEDLNFYFQSSRDIYKTIEKKILNDTTFKYTRVLSLPLNFEFPKGFWEMSKWEKETILLTETLNLCPVFLFQHICRCLKYNLTREPEFRSEFILCSVAVRGNSWCVIDNGKIILEESYRFNKKGHTYPSKLLIMESGGEGSIRDILFNSITEDINDIMDKDARGTNINPAIEFFSIKNALETLKNSFEKELESIKQNPQNSGEVNFEKHLTNKLCVVNEKINYVNSLYRATNFKLE